MLREYPTVLVIGAQKCGTTWLYTMMRQHPEIGVSQPKEVHFFNKANNYKKGRKWYKKHFIISSNVKEVVEFTPNYFWTSEDEFENLESGRNRDIPKLIYQDYPDIKIIVSLRNPIDRAISAYYHHIKMGRVSTKQSILEVMDRFGILSMGYYDVHLNNWLQYYPLDRILILTYEIDFNNNNKRDTLKRVFKHIDVDESFEPSNLFNRYNVERSHFELRTASYPAIIKKTLDYFVPYRIRTSRRWKLEVAEATQ